MLGPQCLARALPPGARPLLKQGYFTALAAVHIDDLLLARHRHPGIALVLNFHRVSPKSNPYWPAMSPDHFRALLRHLQRRCEIVTFEQLAEPDRGQPRVILSFDDGCRDFVEYAVPILEQAGIRANHNLIVDAVERGETPWMIKLVDALDAAPDHLVRSLNLAGAGIGLGDDSPRSKAEFGARLTGHIKPMTPAERELRVPQLTSLVRETDPAAFTPMMSRQEVESLLELHEWGAHSVDHETMSLLDGDAFQAQLDGCEAFMESLSRPMRIFAFPNGMYREEQVRALQARGVEHVLLVGERPATIDGGVHTRITMYGDSLAELRLRAVGHRPLSVA